MSDQRKSSESHRFVGLDAHKRQTTFCILSANGDRVQRGEVASRSAELLIFGRNVLRPTDHVALEATTNCWAIADLLRPHVARVVVSNPMRTRAIADAKIKTDHIDAKVLAELLRCDYLPEVWQPDPETRRMRELASRRSALVAERTALKNRIHAVLAQRLVPCEVGRLFAEEGLAWLRTVDLDEMARCLVDSDLRLLDSVAKELVAIEALIAKRDYAKDNVRLLVTIPCVGALTAQALLAAWGDIKRFRDADHAVSYLGIVASTRQSDTRCYHGPITKRGNSTARWLLVEAAQHLDREPGPLGAFFRRIERRRGRNIAVVAGARKIALVAWHMLTNQEPYRYASPRPTAVKLAKLRLRSGGKRLARSVATLAPEVAADCPDGFVNRVIQSIDQVYTRENLPPLRQPSAAEGRILDEMGVSEHVREVSQPKLLRCPDKRRLRSTRLPRSRKEN